MRTCARADERRRHNQRTESLMAIKIEQTIVGYKVTNGPTTDGVTSSQAFQPHASEPGSDTSSERPGLAEVIQMHERVERPEMLVGSTYKIKTPLSEHALYVTINDVILNPDTEHELRRPFEIFINSKNMEHFQWIVALTLIISAVFRKGGDVTFLVDELRSVFDPKGGYFKKGGRYMPSLVAEIGDAIESHLRMIGLIQGDELEPHQQELVDTKRREFLQASGAAAPDGAGSRSMSSSAFDLAEGSQADAFPSSAQLCAKCSTKAVIRQDGCMTCLNCGDSKCG